METLNRKKIKIMEDLLAKVGEFGRYQWVLTGVLSMMMMTMSIHPVLMVFVALDPSWECNKDNNSTSCHLNGSLPSDDERRCDMRRGDWKYTQPPHFSIISQFDVICHRRWFIYFTTSVFFVGWCGGAVILGSLADKYGRKPILSACICLVVFVGLLSAFSPNLYVFALSRLITGVSVAGISTPSLIMASEFVGSKQRAISVTTVNGAFPIGCAILGVVAYFVPRWKIILIICTAPFALLIFSFKFLPESLRWLRLKGRLEEATQLLEVMAKWNGNRLNENMKVTELSSDVKSGSTMDIFRTSQLLTRSLVQGYGAFTHGIIFYGLLLAANDLSGNLYLDFIILNLTHVPSNLLAIFLLQRYGRKKTVTICKLFTGISCISISFAPRVGSYRIMRTILGNLGTLFTTIVGSGSYLWSSEIYPTSLRASGMGFLDFLTNAGGGLSPWIANGLASVWKEAPFLVMGVMCIISFFFLLFLPETKGQRMMETTDDLDGTVICNDMNN